MVYSNNDCSNEDNDGRSGTPIFEYNPHDDAILTQVEGGLYSTHPSKKWRETSLEAEKSFSVVLYVFIKREVLYVVHRWTNRALKGHGETRRLYRRELIACVGTEIAFLLMKAGSCAEFQSQKMFLQPANIRYVMRRGRFKKISSSLRFYSKMYEDVAILDPLWHIRLLMLHFTKKLTANGGPSRCVAIR